MRASLIERNFPVRSLRLFASARSAGRVIDWKNERIVVEDASKADYNRARRGVLLRRRRHLARACAGRRRGRRDRHRQFFGVADGSRKCHW
jgi:aspartate-semialdehyde dehydrogenase